MQLTVRFAIDLAQPGARTRTVLVMSDDEGWRTRVRLILQGEGHRVLVARHSGQALVECMRHRGPIDLLVTQGGHGIRESFFPTRILADHPEAKLLHLAPGLRTRDELVAAVNRTLS